MTYSSLSKRFPKHSYFCGWYFRCQSNKQTLAIIPSVHKTKDSAFCTIQVITDTHAFHVQFPYDDLGEDDDQVRISNNRFGKSGLSLDIHTPEFHVAGSVHFGAFTPIKYDINPASSQALTSLSSLCLWSHLCDIMAKKNGDRFVMSQVQNFRNFPNFSNRKGLAIGNSPV